MTANSEASKPSWLSAHGKLWYDDRLYRMAWIAWPQALGLLLFVVLWLAPPSYRQVAIPWAKPVVETQKTPEPAPAPPKQSAPPQAEQSNDALRPCKSGEFGQIIDACSALIASGRLTGTDIPDAYWKRGWAYYSTRQYQLAMNDYNRAIGIFPRAWGFFNDRGLVWMALENNERAMQDFDQAILIKPDAAIPYLNRGNALNNMKRPNEALLAFTAAIERDSSLYAALLKRATIYEGRSDWRATYDDGNRMIQLQPNNRMGYEYRGHAYLESSQYQPAINDFSKAISLDPSEIYSYRMRGRAYYFLNQFDNAMADYQSALRIDPKDGSTITFADELRRRQRGR